MPVPSVYLLENRDEHWWNVLEEILRFHAIEKRGVLSQFVCYLINDEAAAVREGLVRLGQQGTFLVDLENTKRNSGKNVIAVRNPSAFKFLQQTRSIPVDDMHARVIGKLALEIPRKSGIQLEEEQLRSGGHPAGDLAGMDAFARAVLSDYPRFVKIHLVSHPVYQRL